MKTNRKYDFLQNTEKSVVITIATMINEIKYHYLTIIFGSVQHSKYLPMKKFKGKVFLFKKTNFRQL